MYKSKNTIAVLILLIFPFAAMAQGFKIDGKTTGIKDSTWLYLRTSAPQKSIDSALVINSKFSLSGKIDETAREVVLHDAKYTNYVVFWVENKNISIAVKAGEFKKGIIKGSATQDEGNEFRQSRIPINKQTDSLNNLLKNTTDTETRKALIARLKAVKAEDRQFDIDYVKNHPQSLIAANLLNIYAPVWGKKTVSVLYSNLNAEIKNTQFGKDINAYIALNKDIKIGDKYTDFEQLNADGKHVKLSGIKGKYILLDFWASWCGPCRDENPSLVKTYAVYKNKGFAILGVSLDDNKTSWLKAIHDDGLTWENVADLKGDKNRAALIYGITGIPDNFLIDESGKIIAKNLRGEALTKKLQELMP